ncbi:MAG TPA: M14 family zinc carboxypeptidase [Planctomycetota bacterium]|nr:M14 family zinc carboxypeptidase [Planctomycetota bacterium]
MRYVLLFATLFFFRLAAAADLPELKVAIDFPGGSAKVEEIDQAGRVIRILPSPHKDRGWACWWYLKIEGINPGETLTLEVGGGVWAQPRQAVFSSDNATWIQTAPGTLSKGRMIYKQKIDAAAAWFAWGPPFTLKDAQSVVERTAKSPHAKAFELCKSTEGRSVPAVRVTQTDDPKRFGIWVHARQHAWESGSSWVCRGFAEWIVSDDPRAEVLRKKALITIVPVMDVDNVEIGAGGKEQKPQDHNRDWSENPHWPAVRAAQKEIKAQSDAGAFDLFIDLHNPGANDKKPYYYSSPKDMLSQRGWTNLQTLISVSKEEITGPLKFIGTVKESGASYDKNWKAISKNWVSKNTSPHVVAVTLETSWNVPESTTENYMRVGKELGLAMERYFREKVRD